MIFFCIFNVNDLFNISTWSYGSFHDSVDLFTKIIVLSRVLKTFGSFFFVEILYNSKKTTLRWNNPYVYYKSILPPFEIFEVLFCNKTFLTFLNIFIYFTRFTERVAFIVYS